MSVVRINAIEVGDGMGEMLEQRFAQRAGAVDGVDGFEGFELLRPTGGGDTYFVYTRWASEEAYQAWRQGETFDRSHGHGGSGGDAPRPVGTGSQLLEFDVVISVP